MSHFKSVLIGVAAMILAYAIIVLFAYTFQDALFGGLRVPGSPLHHLLIGGAMTVVGAIIGGYVLAIVAKKKPFIYATVLAILILVEGIYLSVSGISPNLLLFDIAASSSLSIGVLLGCYTRMSKGGLNWRLFK